nr:protein-glutamine gamma-glutamyltransferase K-like isoform X6 [Halisarca dujardinii]
MNSPVMKKRSSPNGLKRPKTATPVLGGTRRPQTSSGVFSRRIEEEVDSQGVLKRAQSHHVRKGLQSKSAVLSSHTPAAPPARRFLSASNTVNYSSTSYSRLEITSTEFLSKETPQENCTSRFHSKPEQLILRRGNSLILKLQTSLIFTSEYTVTLVFVAAQMKRERFGEFRASGNAKETKELWLSIEIPGNFPVGKFQPHVTLTLKDIPEIFTCFHQGSVVVLFNALNPEDDSYFQYTEDLDDYLFSDKGVIWRGNSRQPLATPWEYGQYDEHCLDTALLLLYSLTPEECRSAALVSRRIISRINAHDNSGVLASGYYGSLTCGTHPCRWTGSTSILQMFLKTRFPVKYGQCFVFSAVAVTVLRSLGIACRPVTCYNCAPETAAKGRVERYFTSDGDLAHSLCKDSVWVYHVWVEAWMKREDITIGFDGWQVLDAIPTSKLSGQFRAGPASVAAIREHLTSKLYPYNGDTVSDLINFEVNYLQIPAEAGQTVSGLRHASLVHIDNGLSSIVMLTSAGNHRVPIDITDYYAAGQSQVRTQGMTSAVGSSKLKKAFVPSKKKMAHHPLVTDCNFEVVTKDDTMLGETVNICVKIVNKGSAIRQLSGKVVGKVVKYTGTVTQNFMSMKFSGIVNPGQDASVSLPIESKKYLKHLVEQAMLQFFVIITVKETQQVFIKLHNFRFLLPDVEVVCPPFMALGSSLRVKLRWKNPLQTALSRVAFLVQAKGLCSTRELSCKRTILPGAPAVVEFPIKACEVGKQWILTSLHCDQLTDVRGWTEVTVVSCDDFTKLKKSMDL